MRIVAGKYRRRKLHANPGLTTRPITDRAKEMLFQRLQRDVERKRIADVFAGTGTLGLEALSRGAAGVVFIENDRRAFDLLQRNVQAIAADDETLCWRTDALKTSFRPRGVGQLLPFETIFFDPPYKMIADIRPGTPIYRSLERLARNDISTQCALLVLRTPKNTDFQCPAEWRLDRVIDLKTMEVHLFDKAPQDEPNGELGK